MQHRKWGLLVIEAVKQHLGHLSLLLPVEIRVSFGLEAGIIRSAKILKMLHPPVSLLSGFPRLHQDFQKLGSVPEK